VEGRSELEEFMSGMLVRQAEAERAIVLGDPEPRRDPVTLFGAAGMSESGWEQLSGTFRRVAASFSDVSGFSFEVEAAGVSGELAYSIGYERFHGSIGGRPAEPITVRVTHVYRREDGEWKIVHRHGDNPPPYERPEAGG
jgi:ketosteroid isomerase-like protein